MSIMDFITFLKGLGIVTPIYPNAFPETASDDSLVVEIGSSFGSRGSVHEIPLTITVRSTSMSKGEPVALDVNNKLKDLSNEIVNGKQIILIKAQQLVPPYLGKDANGKHYYMLDYRVLVSD